MNSTVPIPIIEVTADKLDSMHIGCALGTNAEARTCVASKKDWMRAAFAKGYRFHRLDAKGKALIETIPAENAWCPIVANGWLFIDCLWVSGQFKGHGVGSRLLETACTLAQEGGKKGLCILSADKKRPFLSNPAFLVRKGFVVADSAPPYYKLYALPLANNAAMPRFASSVSTKAPMADGLYISYTQHCPHTERYAGLLAEAAQQHKVPFMAHKITSGTDARKAPNPFTTWAMYWQGEFVTNEIYSVGKLMKFLGSVASAIP